MTCRAMLSGRFLSLGFTQNLLSPSLIAQRCSFLSKKVLKGRILGAEQTSTTIVTVRRSCCSTSKNKKENASKHQRHHQHQPDVPRRIVVRRRGKEKNVHLSHNIRERVGTLISKTARVGGFQKAVLLKRAGRSQQQPTLDIASPTAVQETHPHVSTEEVKDTSGQSILIPGTSVFQSTRANTKGKTDYVCGGETSVSSSKNKICLPIINVSALLHKHQYCIQSATAASSTSGTEAARRLQRGKQELIAVLRQEILSRPPTSPSSSSSPSTYYVLHGHGVPPQLLQAHIDFADSLLRQCQAKACSFSNSAGPLKQVDWLRCRRLSDNSNHVVAWSAAINNNKDNSNDETTMMHEMQLYLTVMDRIAKALGLILPPTTTKSLNTQSFQTSSVDEYDNEWTAATTPTTASSLSSSLSETSSLTSSNHAVLRHWHAEFLIGRSVPPDWLPPGSSKAPVPMVEWTPLTGMAAPGRVTIRLEGYPSTRTSINTTTTTTKVATLEDGNTTTTTRRTPLRRKRPQAISLVFDACFRNT